MTKLLNLTIKINHKNHYKNAGGAGLFYTYPPRIIEPTSLVIKDQAGATVSRLKIRNDSGFGASNAEFLVSSIKKIQVDWSVWDIPISWAWENRGTGTEIEFTLKNLKYNNWNGFKFGSASVPVAGTVADTIFLESKDFEAEVYKNKAEHENKFLSSVIELSNQFSNDVKKTLSDFLGLKRKIIKA
jgi:hypothetical protein